MTPLLTHTSLLVALAGATRGLAVCLRRSEPAPVRLAGWTLGALATWLAAGVAGAFAPVWPALAIGLLGGLSEWRRPPRWRFALGDAVVLAAALGLSTPPLPWERALLLLFGTAAVWTLIEVVVRRVSRPLRLTGAGAGAVALAVLLVPALSGAGERGTPLLPLPSVLPHLGVTEQCEGRRLTLGSGQAGWLSGERHVEGRAALLLHGYDPRGSRQPAACALRRALVTAGFLTLAVDEPGLGASPGPGADAPLAAWDPLPAYLEAYDWLAARSAAGRVAVVGHSMGVRTALRLAAERPVPLLFLFGGSTTERPDSAEDYWYARFHRSRGLHDTISRERWRAIEALGGGAAEAAEAVPADGPRVVFAVFGHEWDDVVAGREALYRRIPAEKEQWRLAGVSHYLNAFQVAGLDVADARALRRTAAGLRARAEALLRPRAAEP